MSAATPGSPTGGPLAGLRVLDISTVIAGPLAATLLADFGAEVVKVELPGAGDGLRSLAPHKDGIPLWWKVTNRNKRGITLDIRTPEGLDLLKRLLPKFDVLVENFRPGTLDRWGLPIGEIRRLKPDMTVLRVSGYGQTGPKAGNAGFARVAEAMSGFTYICGDRDRPPMHLGYPISDSITGLFGAFAVVMARYHKRANPAAAGEEIDVSLYESMFRLLDFLAIEYDQLGHVRERSGNRNQYAGPANVYRTSDDRWVSLAASTQGVFARLAAAVGRADLVDDPRFLTNPDRIANAEPLDAVLAAWFAARSFADASRTLWENGVAFAQVYSIEDIFADDHVAARENIVTVDDPELGPVRMQGIMPKLANNPGAVRSTGPTLGQHNEAVYRELLGLDATEVAALRAKGVV